MSMIESALERQAAEQPLAVRNTTPDQRVAEMASTTYQGVEPLKFDPALLAVGSNRTVPQASLRAANHIKEIAESMAAQMEQAPNLYGFAIENLPEELDADKRRGIVTWLEDHIPLANEDYKWDVIFNGDNRAFVLTIKKRIKRTVKR